MKQRVISGAVIVILAVCSGLAGGWLLLILLLLASLVSFHEAVRAMMGKNGESVDELDAKEIKTIQLPAAAGMIFAAVFYIFMGITGDNVLADRFFLFVLAGYFVVLMSVFVFTYPKYNAAQVAACTFAFIYAPFFISFAYRVRLLPYGKYLYALICICSWVSDSAAYFAGRAFGKHKLSPILSPKKTIEGSIGGIAGSAAGCLITALVLAAFHPGEQYIVPFILIGIAGSIISQVGDLAASAVKRCCGIKDFGNLIPGHGGMLDRFDSFIFTAPGIYYLGLLFMEILNK